MEFLETYTVFIDGIDKTGKDLIRQYVWMLDKRLNVFCRGWPSLVAYAKKFNRDCQYELPQRNALYVHLKVEKADWQIRCKITHEPEIDFEADSKLFDDAFKLLKDEKFHTIEFNTSFSTPMSIALSIVDILKHLNGEKYERLI